MKDQAINRSTSEVEIRELINSEEFIEYLSTILESLDDEITFDKSLSSETVLRKALEILRSDICKK